MDNTNTLLTLTIFLFLLKNSSFLVSDNVNNK